MKKYVCPVCGYVYEGDELPEGFKCPICGVSGEKFQVVEGEMKLAAEHEFGIGTKKNLAWRVECEFGATAGKVELAKVAKKNNLDAIHDTVHEMARDEARHGKALKGLLERYFG